MKHTFSFVCAILTIVTLSVMGWRAYMYSISLTPEEQLLQDNIEALSGGEIQKCTKPKEGYYGPCYDAQGVFKGTWVSAVEEYDVPYGSPVICEHITVHDCPSGSYR